MYSYEPLIRCHETTVEASGPGFRVNMHAKIHISFNGGWAWEDYGEIFTDNPDQMQALTKWMYEGTIITEKELFNIEQQSTGMGTKKPRARKTRALSPRQA